MQQMFTCPQCGSRNAPGQQFCGTCGEKLVASCPHCGASVTPGYRFCGNCGTEMNRRLQQQRVNSQPIPRGQRVRWFERHPNRVVALGLVAIILITYPGFMLFSETISGGQLRDSDSILLLILVVMGLSVYWGMAAWALKLKGRSLGHLAWILLGLIPVIGALLTFIVWLSLKNKRQMLEMQDKASG